MQSREIHGSFPSLSPFPSHLLWFPFVCFESQRHREHFAQISTPLLENDAQFMRGACCKVGQPKNAQGLWIQEQWKIGICLQGEEKNFMGAMYFVIHANICVPVLFLGVGGRVGMCHSSS